MVIKRMFPFFDLALIALALYVGINGAYRYLSFRLEPQPTIATVRRPVTAASEETDRRPYSDYRVIAQRNLFHTNTNGEKPKADVLLSKPLFDLRSPQQLQALVDHDFGQPRPQPVRTVHRKPLLAGFCKCLLAHIFGCVGVPQDVVRQAIHAPALRRAQVGQPLVP